MTTKRDIEASHSDIGGGGSCGPRKVPLNVVKTAKELYIDALVGLNFSKTTNKMGV